MLRFLAASALVAAAYAGMEVMTSYGPVSTNDISLSGVAAFRSIPFAAPPVGNLRFRAPQPPQPWKDALDVSNYAPPCPQLKIDGDIFIGSEDCLKISVYVPPKCHPVNGTSVGCPVMYWIFGGAWILGDATEFGWYEGENLATNTEAVIVAVNYRVGPFGFMALNSLIAEDGSTGNVGLLDQRAGLQWVQKNIANFGGDPSKVTIFGESAGAFSVAFHLASEDSKGLFRGAILESGTFDSPQFFTPVASNIAFNQLYASAVGCNTTSPNGLNDTLTLGCLREKSTQDIMKSLLDFLNPNWPFTSTTDAAAAAAFDHKAYLDSAFRGAAPPVLPALAPVMPWSAAIDGTSAGLKDTPLNCIKKGAFNKDVSVILGTNANEGSIFVPLFPLVAKGTSFPPSDSDIPLMVERALDMYPPALVDNLTATIMSNYPPLTPANNWERASDLLTHYFFTCSTRRGARALSEQGVPTYLYQFNYHLTFLAGLEFSLLGDYHTSELYFVWGNQWPPLVHDFVESDWNISGTIQTYWGNFAKSLNPNYGGAKVNPVNWPSYNHVSDLNVDLNVPAGINQHLLSAYCDLWDNVVATLEASVKSMSEEERLQLAKDAALRKFHKQRVASPRY